MKKILKKIYKIELKIRNALGDKFTYLLIILSSIACYFLGREVGKIAF